MRQPRARRMSMVCGSWADTEWRDDPLLSRSPLRAPYTGGHPLEKRPGILTFSHFWARPAWSRRVGARSTNTLMPGRSEITWRPPGEQNTMWGADPKILISTFADCSVSAAQECRCRFARRVRLRRSSEPEPKPASLSQCPLAETRQ
jgi:hypothetical protein